MFDLIEELAAIHRSVSRDDAGDTVSVELNRTYTADADDVWDALTNPERLPRWFFPVSGELREGGSYQLEGNAGGEIRRCDRPTLLQVTFGSPDSILELRLTELADQTTLALTHTVPLSMAGSGAGALFVGPGWDGALLHLGLILRGRDLGAPLELANTPEMIEFNRGSIDGWTQAVEASGTATEEETAGAREAAVAQYTVVPA